MLKITILTAGKHDSLVQPLVAEYEKRLGRFVDLSWKLIPASDQEVREFKKELSGKQYIGKQYIVLDERGMDIKTADIAAFLENSMNHSWSDIAFVIGGAYGLDDEIRKNAAAIWSFGKITLPHQLMRILVLEQLYRATTINSGHPYHHS